MVLSADFDLGWRPRGADRPGSAVIVDGSSFEVVDRERWRDGCRWTLRPWRHEDVMRVVLPLDPASVASAAATADRERRAARIRPLLWLLSPFLGFAAEGSQRRWRDRWGFPAVLGTWLSALLEAVYGAFCLLEVVISMGAGSSILPWVPRPLVFLGLYLFVEGLYRVVRVAADSEPVGSLFGAAASVFSPRRPQPVEPVPAPEVQALDEDDGVLELASPIQRRDWEGGGRLPYRGSVFRLDATGRRGTTWIYRFRRLAGDDDGSGPRLRLLPPRPAPFRSGRVRGPGPVLTVLISIACTLAPWRFQQSWAARFGIRPGWFTGMGAAAELVGGLSNLGSPAGTAGAALGLNLFFVGEAVTRFAWLILRGRGLGSVLGLWMAPLLERTLDDSPSPPPAAPGA